MKTKILFFISLIIYKLFSYSLAFSLYHYLPNEMKELVYLFVALRFYSVPVLYTNLCLFCPCSLFHLYSCFINLL